MEKFLFKIEAPRGQKGGFVDEVGFEFDGYEHELAAALYMLGLNHPCVKNAILYSADHLRGEHFKKDSENLREESRVKEDQN